MKRIIYFFGIVCLFSICGCAKDWLDIKRNKKQFVPVTLDDAQAILDNFDHMNTSFPVLAEVGVDDIVIDAEDLTGLYVTDQNAFLWEVDIFGDLDDAGWNLCYQRVFYANTVLELLDKLTERGHIWNDLYGQALFHRSWNFYQLAQLFSPPYGAVGDDKEYGIPLKLTSNIYEEIERETVENVYLQIISDLNIAAELIGDRALLSSRADMRSVHALLAKTYLLMGRYDEALQHAQYCLEYGHTLLDYKDYSSTPDMPYPFSQFNDETIFYSQSMSSTIFYADYKLAEELLSSYEENDLRTELYWGNVSGKNGFIGSYSANMYMFNGIAYDEVFLIKAESNFRLGNADQALIDLNYLLEHRYDDTFEPLIISGELILERILKERRKQLLFRSIRWSDIRRLYINHDVRDTLSRMMDGQLYQLESGDRRFTLPISKKVIELGGLNQYPRE